MEVIQLCAFLVLYISSSALKSAYGEDCDPPPRVKDGLFLGRYKKTYSDGSELPFACRESYEIRGDKKIVCTNGEWSPMPQCVESESCGEPPAMSNGFVKGQSTDKMEATYQCNHGYILTGSQKVTCHNGQWTNPPTCLRESCGEPPAMSNGFVKGQSTDKMEATYQCNHGYILTGSQKVTCHNGQWTNPPTCLRESCGEPPAVSNGFLKGQSTDKMEVTYQCNHGYILTGSQKVTCDNGQWTFQLDPPTCIRSIREESKTEQSRPGQGCESPPKIDNGDVIDSNAMKATYQCKRHYTLRGSKDLACRNGQWDEPPVCLSPCSVSSIPAEHNLQSPRDTVYIPEDSDVQFRCISRTYRYIGGWLYTGIGHCRNGKVTFTGCRYYN
ncbi:complement factor H-like isoform X1 [Paramormyrops kingsleyae]|uniref:complement factor H-like isoform X1 n=1 Tax=Paramormyrops kingsleyae TaxID=1676925 RepID=UPI003B97554B